MADRSTFHEILKALRPLIDTKALAKSMLETYVRLEEHDDDAELPPTNQKQIDDTATRLQIALDAALFDENVEQKGIEELDGALSRFIQAELGPFFS